MPLSFCLMLIKIINLCIGWLLLLSRLGKTSLLSDRNYDWWQKCAYLQYAEFSFLPASKAIRAVSCLTYFRVSTAIITFFLGGTSWTLDCSAEAAKCNTKVYFSSCLVFFSTATSHWLKKKNFPCRKIWIIQTYSLFRSHLIAKIWTIIYAEYFVNIDQKTAKKFR